jgi:tetratricopeptide (TPR) repeat protein
VKVTSSGGEKLLEEEILIGASATPGVAIVKIDVSQPKISSAPSNPPPNAAPTDPAPRTKLTKRQIQEAKKKNEKDSEMNVLILQANAALLAQKWQEAVDLSQQLTAMDPDNWEYYSGLGDAQYHLGQYQEAVGSYEAGILAAGDVSAIDPKSADADSARKKTIVAHMLNNEGNAYNQLHKIKEALTAYNKSAALDPDPSLAYYNLCATQYNLRNVETAIPACDKAISVDPARAENYYMKGALLVYVSEGQAIKKLAVPPGAVEALKKYLELAPDGEHAKEAREMLNYLSALANAAATQSKKN